jgi:hypothetical protein
MDAWRRFLLLLLDIRVRSRVLVELTSGILIRCSCGKALWGKSNGPELKAAGLFFGVNREKLIQGYEKEGEVKWQKEQ